MSNIKLNPMYFTTPQGVSIHQRIEDEKTTIFDNELIAKKAADQQRSYYYPVYQEGKSIGKYAIPK